MCWLLAWCSWCRDLPDVGERVALGEVVGVPLPEDVAHPAAGHDLQAPTAHPHPEGELCRRWQRQQGKEPLGKSHRRKVRSGWLPFPLVSHWRHMRGWELLGLLCGCTRSWPALLTAYPMPMHPHPLHIPLTRHTYPPHAHHTRPPYLSPGRAVGKALKEH